MEKAEAEKIAVVKAAEGDAESKYLQGQVSICWVLHFMAAMCTPLPTLVQFMVYIVNHPYNALLVRISSCVGGMGNWEGAVLQTTQFAPLFVMMFRAVRTLCNCAHHAGLRATSLIELWLCKCSS